LAAYESVSQYCSRPPNCPHMTNFASAGIILAHKPTYCVSRKASHGANALVLKLFLTGKVKRIMNDIPTGMAILLIAF
jgi:hypothetical protein